VSIGGSGNTVVASGTNETYLASSGSGQVTIDNATSSGAAAQGQLDFSSGISSQDLWFVQSGNNLNIDILGTQDQFTISNWFGSNPSAQLAEITAGDGLKLDNSVLQLVQAMATYSANNPGFDPTTVTQAPADSSLQTAIAAAWH
jgi:Haemolysin-type calcium binding protein related domain